MMGYSCRVARVNLSDGKVSYEPLEEEVIRKFVGGKGFGYYFIYREVPPGTQPFSRSNKLIFAPGAFSGIVPGGSKVSVVSISPETSLIHDSYAGDRFGPFLKRAGVDLLIVEGISESPVYILVDGEEIEIKDASSLWGEGVYRATRTLWRMYPESAVAAIGPAGESLVRFANIMFDEERAAGRGGLGAVMGSKKLKAVVVEKVNHGPRVCEVAKLEELKKKYYGEFETSRELEELRTYGTTNGLLTSSSSGMAPAYNFQRPHISRELARKLSGEEIKKYEVEPAKHIHGSSCPVKCARYVKVSYNGREFHLKPEYESIAMLGAATGVFDFEKVAYFNHLANDLGIDSIAAGNVIGWLFEMIEKGIVKNEELGMELRGFGDWKAEENLLIHIARRRGIGAILAEGVRRASEILGRGFEAAVHVKGLESPAWDPRGRRTYALSYATADVGASHLRGWPHPHSLPNAGAASELVPSLIESRDKDALFDSLGICKFLPYSLDALQKIYEVITCHDSAALTTVGWRIESIARIYNVLGGMNPVEEDTIPPRWWEKEKEGPAKDNAAFRDFRDFEESRALFYRLRGWHESYGVPLPETLEKLELPEFAEDARRALKFVEMWKS